MVGCSKEVAVIPITYTPNKLTGNWVITNAISRIDSNAANIPLNVLTTELSQEDSDKFVINYKWVIINDTLWVKNNSNVTLQKFDIGYVNNDALTLHYYSNFRFTYPPTFNYILNNNVLTINVDLYYDSYPCGVLYTKSIKRHLILTLKK